MTDHKTANLPWLDNLGMSVPGHSGYQSQAHRRAAAYALRDAILHRLAKISEELEKVRKTYEDQGIQGQSNTLDRIQGHVSHLRERVEGLGTRYESFYTAPDFDRAHINPIHGADLAIIRKADLLVSHFQHPDTSHNLLAVLETDLSELEGMLDGRALMLQGAINGY